MARFSRQGINGLVKLELSNSVEFGPLIPAVDKGFVPIDEDKNAAYEAACPSGLEFK